MSTTPAPSPLSGILLAVKSAADSAFQGVEAQLPTLTQDGLNIFNNIVLPHLDVPSFLVPLITGAESKLSAPVDAFALAQLEFLQKRVDALLGGTSGATPDSVGAFPV